jgi:hypothetical protein
LAPNIKWSLRKEISKSIQPKSSRNLRKEVKCSTFADQTLQIILAAGESLGINILENIFHCMLPAEKGEPQ